METKVCNKCGLEKSIDEFYLDASKGYTSRKTCSGCQRADGRLRRAKNPDKKRDAHLWSTYRIRLEDYDSILKSQGKVCAICKKKELEKVLHVDHDHITGKVRGLLCKKCNSAIGYLSDDTNVLKSAIDYLKGAV